MRLASWPLWMACGLTLALLVVSPLAAQAPGQSAQVGGAVCPLSDAQTQKATTAFDRMAQTFTTEPRCVNCHGGVNPFAPDADQTHGGRRVNPIFKPVPILDMVGIKVASDEVDVAATNEQCQECHSGLRGWKLAPPQDVFKGRMAVQICRNQRVVFGRLLKQGPAGFAGHIEHDVKDVRFIDNAFLGTRGLNEVGQAMATGGFPDPPKGITHDQLNALARQWADALGSKFQGDDDCGCAPHHYALLLEEQLEVRSSVQNSLVIMRAAGQVQIPITFKDDGSFSGSGQYTRIIDETIEVPEGTCAGKTTPQTVTLSLSGSVEGSDVDNPGTLHIKLNGRTSDTTLTVICRVNGRSTSTSSNLSGGDVEANMPDIPAAVGESSNMSITVPGLGGTDQVKLTVRQVD